MRKQQCKSVNHKYSIGKKLWPVLCAKYSPFGVFVGAQCASGVQHHTRENRIQVGAKQGRCRPVCICHAVIHLSSNHVLIGSFVSKKVPCLLFAPTFQVVWCDEALVFLGVLWVILIPVGAMVVCKAKSIATTGPWPHRFGCEKRNNVLVFVTLSIFVHLAVHGVAYR